MNITKAMLRILLLTAVVATAACSSQRTVGPTPAAAPLVSPTTVVRQAALPSPTASVVRFEAGPCPFQVPANPSRDVQCGFVVVPEDHSNPAGPTIRLAVVVVKSRSSTRPADPVILLSGGPGEKTVASAVSLAIGYASLYGERDFIIFDQRGAGLSRPSLECPEYVQMSYDTMAEPNPEVVLKAAFESTIACRDRLVKEGHNLSLYNTVQNAADVNAIRFALGYDKVNLFGGSYGTLLAQAVMRDYPQGIRSVAMASVLPLEKSYFVDVSATAPKAVMRLVDACTADKDCNRAYPNLAEVLFKTTDRLNANPVPLTLTHPLNGKSYQALLTGSAVFGNLVRLLYQTELMPVMPRAIYDVYNGDYALMTQLLNRNLIFPEAVSLGMELSVLCADDLIGRTQQELLDDRAATPQQFLGSTAPELVVRYGAFAICQDWQVKQADPSVKRPLVSDIPTLVLTGEFDPVTPPEYGRLVAGRLRNSYFFNLPSAGHNVIATSECARQVAGAFFTNPDSAPEATCIAKMTGVVFNLPAKATKVTLKLFSDPESGFSGLIPESWKEVQPHNWARGTSALDQAVFIQGAEPGSAADLFDNLMAQLKTDPKPAALNRTRLGNFTWDFYTFDRRGNPVDLAIAEDGKRAYFVFLMSPRDEHDVLYEQVFLPAAKAMASLP